LTLRGLGDVKQLQRLWCRCPENHRGVLVVLRSVTGAVEEILGIVPRHRTTEMRAFPIGGDDPARRVEKEEPSLAKEDRTVVRGRERTQDLGLGSHRDRIPEPFDAVDPDERRDERDDLSRSETDGAKEPKAEDRP